MEQIGYLERNWLWSQWTSRSFCGDTLLRGPGFGNRTYGYGGQGLDSSGPGVLEIGILGQSEGPDRTGKYQDRSSWK